MKQLHQLISMMLGLIVFTVGFSANAERYLLVYQNKQSFQKLHNHWMSAPSPMANRIFSLGNKPVRGIEIQDSLSAVQSVVVNVEDPADLSLLSGEAIIEKEFFHKSPRPVANYESTKAWDFQARYMNSISNPLRNEKLDDSEQPVSPSVNGLTPGPKTPWGIINVRAMEAWAGSHQGEGARVMVLDTGIDVNHPALKNQIEETKDFVSGEDNVEDKVGHGTHVSGTIAGALASDGFTGVAPKAKILMGRVCSEDGCSSISVVSGINWAIEKKVDVVNLSLGSDFGSSAEKNAIQRAENAGVAVVAASGNDGKPSVGFPAAYSSVIAVGAINSQNVKADFSQWGPELDIVGPGVDVTSSVPQGTGCDSKVSVVQAQSVVVNSTCFSGSAFLSSAVQKPMVFVGLGKPEDFSGVDLSNKYALIKRGEIPFVDKVRNAMAANAAGIVIFNNQPGLMSGSISEDGSVLAVPVVMIEQDAGNGIVKNLQGGKSVELSVKTFQSDYSAYSGTSMATPHVAGVVALVKAANKSLTPAQVRDLLKSSTTSIKDDDASHTNWYGAGAVNAEKAVAKALQAQ